jgi:chromosome segregation ATPase
MKNFNPLLVAALLFCMMSMWGCNQQKTGAISTKIRELETRYSKLEEDYRTLQAAHEQHRKRLNQSEAQRIALENDKTELTSQLETASNERDTLRKQISQRTQERDTAQTNLMQFSKDLQALAGRVESALNTNSPKPNDSTVIPVSRRNE